MWGPLKPSDLERAQQELADRRAATLRRHQDELAGLEADRAVVENLDRLADAFCQAFRTAVTAAPAAAAPPEPPEAKSLEAKSPETLPPQADPTAKPVPAAPAAKPAMPIPAILNARDKTPRDRTAPAERRNLTGTNFDIFRRAVSKSTF